MPLLHKTATVPECMPNVLVQKKGGELCRHQVLGWSDEI